MPKYNMGDEVYYSADIKINGPLTPRVVAGVREIQGVTHYDVAKQPQPDFISYGVHPDELTDKKDYFILSLIREYEKAIYKLTDELVDIKFEIKTTVSFK